MENKKKNKGSQKKQFLAVDVWRSQFGVISVKAIYEIFSAKFGVDQSKIRDYSFTHCVNALRRLEDPTYKDPVNKSHSDVEFVGEF
jgi:hypothetical protein